MMPRLFAASTLLLAGPLLAAGGSWQVDDASIVDPGRCQLEAWVTAVRADANTSTWVPACNGFGVEWSVALGFEGGGRTFDEIGVGIKRAWAIDQRLAVGIAVGSDWTGGRRLESGVRVPLSLDPRGDGEVLLHANVGSRHRRGDGWRATAGVGVDVGVAGPLRALIEVFAVDRGETIVQGGLRWWHGESLSFDLVAGRERDGGDRANRLMVGVNIGF